MITTDLFDRLRAALPEDVPVLFPEQHREPLEAAPVDAQGRPMVGGGERGLGAYLKQHPAGYVQIEQPIPITSDGLAGTFWVTVASLHTSEPEALTLGLVTRAVLCGHPINPGHYREVTPAQPERISSGVWAYRITITAHTLHGGTP